MCYSIIVVYFTCFYAVRIPSDTELLEQVAVANETAFNLLFARYRDQLFTHLSKITKSRKVAEEVVVDVFLKIWNGRAALLEINHFEVFLVTVARNRPMIIL
jgi:RNA polymerase sigma-70 factor (ECF subfamily)